MSNGFESFVTFSVEVEIDVANILYISLRPAVGTILDRIHSHEHVIATGTLTREPRLKTGARDGLRLGDGLNRVSCRPIPHEDRGIVLRLEHLPDVLLIGERARRERAIGAHG